MQNEFDSWLNFDSDSNHFHSSEHVSTPVRQDQQWRSILKPEEKQILDESNKTFPSVKRKYEEKFSTKGESLTSSSPFLEDDEAENFQSIIKTKSQQQGIIKNQRDQIKRIQQENRYLKQKVDDLSFRLKETEIQLNKLKYSGNNNIANFESMKQNYLKEINQLMDNQKGHAQQTCQVFKKLKELTDFDGKLKVDLLNYFMSELLENIINDSTFYYIDSILKRKGLWKESVGESLRKVDEEVVEIGSLNSPNKLRDFKRNLQEALQIPGQKYKQCWKAFYRSYITLLNQGFVLQNFLRMAMGKIFTFIEKQDMGKIQLHFQKIKLRKDIRLLRQSWFKEIQYDQQGEKREERGGRKIKNGCY